MKDNNSSDNMKLVFIAGLGHSGSTLLDLLLGAQKDVVGLGEVDIIFKESTREKYLQKFDKYPCTCGKTPSCCNIWGSMKMELMQDNTSYVQLYKMLINVVRNETSCTTIVDSSKNIHALKRVYHALPEINIDKSNFYVIHLVKDIRSYTTSMLKHSKRNDRILYHFWKWFSINKEIETFLREESVNHLRIGYEELALSTGIIGKKILGFLNSDSDQFSENMNESKSHIIFGNNMRLKNSDDIQYDYRWFLEPMVQFCYSIASFVDRKNRQYVYGNVSKILMKNRGKNKKE